MSADHAVRSLPPAYKDFHDRILGFMAAHAGGFASLDEAAAAVAAYQPQRTQKSDPSGLRKNLRQREDGRWYYFDGEFPSG